MLNTRIRFVFTLPLCVMIGLFLQNLSGDWMIKWENKTQRDLSIQHNGIIHVISPFKVSNCEEPFCPFDQAQSVVIASMIRAKAKSRVPVTLAAATSPEDRNIIPPDFMTLPSLLRDSKSEYPNVPNMKKLPFIQDIFDRVLEATAPFDYVIYTNSDIILHEEFYNIVESKIQEGYGAFTINRHTIGKSRRINNTDVPYTALDLDKIYKLRGKTHPGHDCFVMRKDVLSRVDMGDIFLGARLFAGGMMMQLPYLAKKFRAFKTKQLKATYHLGNDRTWRQEIEISKQNVRNALCGLPKEIMEKCYGNFKGMRGTTCREFHDAINSRLGRDTTRNGRLTNKGRKLCSKTS